MLAFVLSGGGNRGALQVGALQVLLEAGIKPDLIVGSSIGAVNAVLVAADPTVRGAYALADAWRRVTRHDVYPGNVLTPLWSILRGHDGLYPNQNWYRYLRRVTPAQRFGEIGHCQIRVVATDLLTGNLATFGEDPDMWVVDALMASTALPPLHAPWRIRSRPYIDGGTVADLPVRVALDLGARTVFALNIANSGPADEVRSVFGVSNQAVTTLLRRQIWSDMEHARSRRGVRLYELDLRYTFDGAPWDFSHTNRMIRVGRDVARQFLAESDYLPVPLAERVTRVTATVGESLSRAASPVSESLSGATERVSEWAGRVAMPLLAAGTERFVGLWYRPRPAQVAVEDEGP